MKFMLRAAMAAVSIGSIPPAMAGENGTNPNRLFTEVPEVIAQVPAQNAPSIDTSQPLQALDTVTQPAHSPWLFPPIGKYFDRHAG
jgi:hypothetical protein